jgi:hypothetical protein
MNTRRGYVLDADVFITAKNRYYGFDICPGFWASLIHHHALGGVCSIDRVKGELLAGHDTEDLVLWVKNDLPQELIGSTNEEPVVTAYRQVISYAPNAIQYSEPAKAVFAAGADGWLVAYAMVNSLTVVTNEQPRPESRRRILRPDVCSQIKVVYTDTFFMLKDLQIKFEWRGAR